MLNCRLQPISSISQTCTPDVIKLQGLLWVEGCTQAHGLQKKGVGWKHSKATETALHSASLCRKGPPQRWHRRRRRSPAMNFAFQALGADFVLAYGLGVGDIASSKNREAPTHSKNPTLRVRTLQEMGIQTPVLPQRENWQSELLQKAAALVSRTYLLAKLLRKPGAGNQPASISKPNCRCGTSARTNVQQKLLQKAGAGHQPAPMSKPNCSGMPVRATSPHQFPCQIVTESRCGTPAPPISKPNCYGKPVRDSPHQFPAKLSRKAGAGHQPARISKPNCYGKPAELLRKAGAGQAKWPKPNCYGKPVRDTSLHEFPSQIATESRCGTPARTNFQAKLSRKAGAGHQPAPMSKSNCYGKPVRDTSPHQLPSQLSRRAGAGHQPAPISKPNCHGKSVRDTSPHQFPT